MCVALVCVSVCAWAFQMPLYSTLVLFYCSWYLFLVSRSSTPPSGCWQRQLLKSKSSKAANLHTALALSQDNRPSQKANVPAWFCFFFTALRLSIKVIIRGASTFDFFAVTFRDNCAIFLVPATFTFEHSAWWWIYMQTVLFYPKLFMFLFPDWTGAFSPPRVIFGRGHQPSCVCGGGGGGGGGAGGII